MQGSGMVLGDAIVHPRETARELNVHVWNPEKPGLAKKFWVLSV